MTTHRTRPSLDGERRPYHLQGRLVPGGVVDDGQDILLEDGFVLLQENGDHIHVE